MTLGKAEGFSTLPLVSSVTIQCLSIYLQELGEEKHNSKYNCESLRIECDCKYFLSQPY